MYHLPRGVLGMNNNCRIDHGGTYYTSKEVTNPKHQIHEKHVFKMVQNPCFVTKSIATQACQWIR